MTETSEDQLFNGKTAIIFDFDGTIADTLPLHDKAFQQTLSGYPLTFNYGNYAGMSTRKAIALIFAQNQQSLSDELLQVLTKQKQLAANARYKEAISFMPGAEALIRLLHDKKFSLFVASSGSGMNVNAGLEALGIRSLFKGVITADDVEQAKPHPEIFLRVLEQYNINPAQAIVIEDALSGIASAKAAGIDVVCINPEITGNINGSPFCTATMVQLKQQLSNEPQRQP